MPTCSKCGEPYRNYMGPLLEDFIRKGPRTETVTKEMRCEGCGHLLGYKIWKAVAKQKAEEADDTNLQA